MKLFEVYTISAQKQIIKYRYALNPERRIIDIESVNQQEKEEYKCISCDKELVSVIGEKRKRHFRHKVLTESCSLETYLHKMGKHLFCETYRDCRENKRAYEIQYNRPCLCTVCKERPPCEMQAELATDDLTKYFTKIDLEKTDNGVIPDLILRSDSGEKMYIEIAVTHLSTEDKKALGTRLIEIKIENEDDLSLISSCKLSENDERVEFINFRRKPIEGDFSSRCYTNVILFILNIDGSSIVKTMTWYKYKAILQDKGPVYRLMNRDTLDTYIQELEKAYHDGLVVRNCFLCRYHAKAKGYQKKHEDDGPIFCKFQRSVHHSNDAVKCKYYKPDPYVFRFYK